MDTQFIIKPKSSGKTKDLIKLSLELNIPIFAPTETKRISLLEKSYAYFNQPILVATIDDVCDYDKVLIDDADELLQSMFYELTGSKAQIVAATLSNE